MSIANIVSEYKVDVPKEFNVVSSIDLIDNSLPTLIVGYEKIVSLYPEFNILERVVEPNIYWTFRRNERRDKYEEDLDWFIRKVYADLTSNIIYLFVDPIIYRGRTLIKIIRKIYSLESLITFQHNEMLYLYGDNFIFGLDMNLLKFMGLNIDKIKNKIKSKSLVFLGDDKILIEYKRTIRLLNNQIRYIPYLYSILNGKDPITSIIHSPRKG